VNILLNITTEYIVFGIMTSTDPAMFQNLPPYMRARLMMAAAIIFRNSDFKSWSYGHEKLLGIVLWNYEKKREKRFKYAKLFKRHAYGRTHNYILLKKILEEDILVKEGNGFYAFTKQYHDLIEQIFIGIKNLDKIKIEPCTG
jgi:hypothetical protein